MGVEGEALQTLGSKQQSRVKLLCPRSLGIYDPANSEWVKESLLEQRQRRLNCMVGNYKEEGPVRKSLQWCKGDYQEPFKNRDANN